MGPPAFKGGRSKELPGTHTAAACFTARLPRSLQMTLLRVPRPTRAATLPAAFLQAECGNQGSPVPDRMRLPDSRGGEGTGVSPRSKGGPQGTVCDPWVFVVCGDVTVRSPHPRQQEARTSVPRRPQCTTAACAAAEPGHSPSPPPFDTQSTHARQAPQPLAPGTDHPAPCLSSEPSRR